MAYFDSVQHTTQTKPDKQLLGFVQLAKIIEQRALEVVNNKYPHMVDFMDKTSPIIIDPYANYSSDDSRYWQELFILSQDKPELYARLFFMRGGGTKLIKNNQWGFVMQPIVGQNGWNSMEQYNQEKQCLNDYMAEIVKLFKHIANARFAAWQ